MSRLALVWFVVIIQASVHCAMLITTFVFNAHSIQNCAEYETMTKRFAGVVRQCINSSTWMIVINSTLLNDTGCSI